MKEISSQSINMRKEIESSIDMQITLKSSRLLIFNYEKEGAEQKTFLTAELAMKPISTITPPMPTALT